MNLFVYAVETVYDKKPKMPDQTCANGLQLHHIPQDLQKHITTRKKSYISKNPIHNNTSHETIWWSL